MQQTECSRGWAKRCAASHGPRCKCACGGRNHGKDNMNSAPGKIDWHTPNVLVAYPNIEAYYSAVPAARESGESDFGVWWRDPSGATWRVSWVHATGDVYAIRQGRPTVQPLGWPNVEGVLVQAGSDGKGPVLIIGRFPPMPEHVAKDFDASWKWKKERIEPALEGWAQVCGRPNSLAWIAQRVPRNVHKEPENGD